MDQCQSIYIYIQNLNLCRSAYIYISILNEHGNTNAYTYIYIRESVLCLKSESFEKVLAFDYCESFVVLYAYI